MTGISLLWWLCFVGCPFRFSVPLCRMVRNSAIIKIFSFRRAILSLIIVKTLSAGLTISYVLVLTGGFRV